MHCAISLTNNDIRLIEETVRPLRVGLFKPLRVRFVSCVGVGRRGGGGVVVVVVVLLGDGL